MALLAGWSLDDGGGGGRVAAVNSAQPASDGFQANTARHHESRRLTDASLRTGDTVTGRFTATLSGTMTPGVRRHSRQRF